MPQRAHKIRMLDDLKGRTLDELLREVVRSREPLTIILEQEELVTIELASQLKPLPRLEGCVPEGWKDVAYNRIAAEPTEGRPTDRRGVGGRTG